MVTLCPTIQFHCVSLSWFRQWQRWLPVTWAYWIWTVDDGRWRQGHPHSLIIRREGGYKADSLISLYFVNSCNFACPYYAIGCFAHAIGRFFCPWTMHCCHCMGSVPLGLVNIYLIAERISARLWIGDLFSQSTYVRTYVCTYVRMYVVDHTQECHVECRYIPDIGMGHMTWYVCHTVWHIQIRSTQILFVVLWWWRWRSGTQGHRSLDTTTPNSLYSKFANITHATRASPAPAFLVRVQSAHWREAKMRMRIPRLCKSYTTE